MIDDARMRLALRAAALYNAGGALLFAFPETLGSIVGFPAGAPPVYTGLLVLFVLLFGGTYAWLAARQEIDRPLVAVSAIGKAGAFAVVLAAWAGGGVPWPSVVAVSGDLAFAVVFAAWLRAPGVRAGALPA